MKVNQRHKIAVILGIVSLLVMINPAIPYQALSMAGERPPAPDGYKWCLGYQYIGDQLVLSNEMCPQEYLCMSKQAGFFTEDEARTACPTEWVKSVKPIIVQENPTNDKQGSVPIIPAMVLVLSIGYLIKDTKEFRRVRGMFP